MPEKYVWQLQHQFLVSGCKRGFLVMINEAEEIKYLPVEPNEEMMARLIGECTIFWEHVLTRKPPELSPQDYKELRVKGAAALAEKFKRLKTQISALETELEEIRGQLLAMMSHPRMTCRGVKFVEVTRQGTIQYAKIPELKQINLEQYRGSPTKSWRIEI